MGNTDLSVFGTGRVKETITTANLQLFYNTAMVLLLLSFWYFPKHPFDNKVPLSLDTGQTLVH